MNQAPDLPLWAAWIVGILVLAGAVFTLIGALGLLRFKTYYERAHAPSIGATVGTGSILLASVISFTITEQRLAVHEILIAVFLTLTTPITLMLLSRAALYRDRIENQGNVPKDYQTPEDKADKPVNLNEPA